MAAQTYAVELTAQQMSYLKSAMDDTRTVNSWVADVREPEFAKIREAFDVAKHEGALA